ncbi:C-X-C chemokine receptor type 1-like [Salarias fasciatus]|uniref:C-X-C chemokine receptor type 1-like n=1 Tax=Salarias fasciatus TaxID=181472 RepID=UPI0011765846|nr:C-X-C chemokine receptor type 1-like [Salarias fasciatus]
MSITYVFSDDYFAYNSSVVFDVNPKTIPCELEPLQTPVALSLCVILIVIFLLAIPGNMLVGIAGPRLDFGDFMCKFLNLVIEANFYTSIIFLACISIDRYLVIVHSNETLKGRHRCSRLLCAAVWALGWALALPALFHDAFQPDPDSPVFACSETFDIGSATMWRLATRGFRHIFGFLVPLVVMVTCYTITVTRLLHTRGFQKHRAMRVIIAVVVAFLLCWLPYHITMVVDTLLRAELIKPDCTTRKAVNLALVVTNTLALLHSCINPFLYAFVGEKFRERMKVLLRRKLRQERLSISKISRTTSQTSEGAGTIS